MMGPPDSFRFPYYFNLNLHFERQFRALHYLWAWRCGFNNLTNNGNPNVVNNVAGTSAISHLRQGPAARLRGTAAAAGPEVSPVFHSGRGMQRLIRGIPR